MRIGRNASHGAANILSGQDAEKARQRRSPLEQVLNVPQRVRLRPVLRLRPCWTSLLSILRERFFGSTRQTHSRFAKKSSETRSPYEG
jgi:hypothetical protein